MNWLFDRAYHFRTITQKNPLKKRSKTFYLSAVYWSAALAGKHVELLTTEQNHKNRIIVPAI